MPEKQRGGYRPGSGRPVIPAEQRRIKVTVTLPPETVRLLRDLGGGNLSRGIDRAAARLFRKE